MDKDKFYNGDYHIGEPLKETQAGRVYKKVQADLARMLNRICMVIILFK